MVLGPCSLPVEGDTFSGQAPQRKLEWLNIYKTGDEDQKVEFLTLALDIGLPYIHTYTHTHTHTLQEV